jgi:hypothetical protein
MADSSPRIGYIGAPISLSDNRGFWGPKTYNRVIGKIAEKKPTYVDNELSESSEEVEPTTSPITEKVIECPRDINPLAAVSKERRQVFLDLVVNNSFLSD